MKKLPPSSPADVLDISSPLLKGISKLTIATAKRWRYWQYPYAKATTVAEDMTLMDLIYWLYKCINPIARPEVGQEAFFEAATASAALPAVEGATNALTLGAAGDLLYTPYLEGSKDVLFENIADLLFGQDVSFANFESPITEQALEAEVIGDKGPPVECCSREQFDSVKGHKDKRFTVFNTANNHKFDKGIEGVETTQRVLAENGILEIGTNRAPGEQGQGRIVETNGIKLGWASATFGLNGRVLPAGQDYRINVADLHPKRGEAQLDLVKRQIDDCKNKGCDFIVASLHWGYEFEFFPRQQQTDIAHALIEYGADAIIAHHPHVIQPVEYYRTKRDPGRVAVIAYSLGTLTWGFFAPHLALSLVLNLKLAKGSVAGRAGTYIERVGITPVFRHRVEKDGRGFMRIEKLADALKGPHDLYPPGFLAQMKSHVQTVLGKLFPF